jgi:hypothetical protein
MLHTFLQRLVRRLGLEIFVVRLATYDDSNFTSDDELLVGDIVDENKPENVATPAIEALSCCDGE